MGHHALPADAGVYLDSSALAKLYLPEPESDTLEAFLLGRRDLTISELAITEVLSAVARRRREGMLTAHQALEIRDGLLADAESGAFHRLDMNPTVHREAERLLFNLGSVALRTPDSGADAQVPGCLLLSRDGSERAARAPRSDAVALKHTAYVSTAQPTRPAVYA